MKKLKFTMQVFILVIAFPALFIAGITRGPKTDAADTKQDLPATVNKSEAKNSDCLCNTGRPDRPGIFLIKILNF